MDRRVADACSRLLECAPSHTLDELLERTLDEAEMLSDSVVGFYHVVDQDQANLSLHDWSTRTKAECGTPEGKGRQNPLESARVRVECVHARIPAIHNGYTPWTNRKGLPEGDAELVRELVVPVMREGFVRAILGVGNKPTDYDQGDMESVGQLVNLAWDIAEAKIARDELQVNLERLRAVANHAPDWETWTTSDGTSAHVSASCERIPGYSPAEFVAHPGLMTQNIHAADRPHFVEHVRASGEEGRGEDLEIEFRILKPGGQVAWISHWCTPVYGQDGEWLGRRGNNRDITGRKRIEERLAGERRLLEQVEAVAHIGSWRIGLGKRELSEETARVLGCDCPPLDGDVVAAVRAVVHPDDRELFGDSRIRTLLAEGIRPIDFRIVRSDGAVRWISAQGEVEKDEDGEPIAVNGILQDVTERKDSEERRVGQSEQDANTDRLTGLLNLRGFGLVADKAVSQADRASRSVGLLFCDIDGLKTINDELGHAEGDRALIDAASVLESTLRSADAIARMGGDEFAVLAIGSGAEDVAYLLERLQSAFELLNKTHDRPYQLSVSIGGASCEPGVPCRLEELRAMADSRMYAEKMRRRPGAGRQGNREVTQTEVDPL